MEKKEPVLQARNQGLDEQLQKRICPSPNASSPRPSPHKGALKARAEQQPRKKPPPIPQIHV